MKYLSVLLFTVLMGCASADKRAGLQTDNPDGRVYTMFFGAGIVSSLGRNDLPVSERYKQFESILNKYLQDDINTKSCNVVTDSISLSPLGPGGSAQVKCVTNVPVLGDNTSFISDGKKFYRYWVNDK